MQPVYYTNLNRPSLNEVLVRNGTEVITSDYLIEKNNPWINLMSLPILLDVKEKDLWHGPYLEPKRNPQNKLKSNKKKIGIKCGGNPYFQQDVFRSIPIDDLLEIIPKNCEVYLFDLENTHERCINLKDKIHGWEDTFDFIDQMDLIVSSCTSIVHAAGSIGKPTVVMTPIPEYYLWTSTRKDDSTPWYGDNFHIARQQKPRDWTAALDHVKSVINNYV
jgi:ADP-heptose:LPS heptosyltransferase